MRENNHDQLLSSMVEINASGMPAKKEATKRKSVWSKADARYWLDENRIFKNHDSPEYSCRFTKQKRREHFALGSPNKKIAAAKAAEIYSCLQANGWDATLEKYRPKASQPEQQPAVVTVGAFIEAACRISPARTETLDAYTKAFRLIVSQIKKIDRGRKFDSSGGGSLEWRNKVDAVELASITPTSVVIWKNKRLKAAKNPLKRQSASVTVNSLIRNAKALFGKKVLPFLKQILPLPSQLPFEEVPFEEKINMRYNSKMDSYAILVKAAEELRDNDPEAFKIVILALVFGLRRSEIDNLLWEAFNLSTSKLIVESTEHHALKSKNSAGILDITAETLAFFRADLAKHPTSVFVIECRNPLKKSKSRKYRCEKVFNRVLKWLRAQGVESAKPLHTLRKEVGSVINQEFGIYAASRFLRHSDIRITAEYYLDTKETVSPTAYNGYMGQQAMPESRDSTGPAETESNHDSRNKD